MALLAPLLAACNAHAANLILLVMRPEYLAGLRLRLCLGVLARPARRAHSHYVRESRGLHALRHEVVLKLLVGNASAVVISHDEALILWLVMQIG